MNFELICSDNLKPILLELLANHHVPIDEQAKISIVEAGYPPPEDKLYIVFQPENLFLLMDLLGEISKVRDKNNKIIGRSEDERYNVISLSQIYYFEGRGNYTYCITADDEYRVKERLYELETKLPQDQFIRVGKSFIVNITNVKEITPWFGRRLVIRFLKGKKEIEVSKNYVKKFKEFLGM